LPLRPQQAEAFAKIAATLDAGEFGAFLLQGVTGSGKTEIYLQALARTLEQGRAGVVLVPEISLTPQTVSRFRARFGDRIGVYHSRLTPLDKLRLSRDIESGRVDVVIGARSALFAPFKRLGLIVVDEEHESSYKQESVPRYHARDVALVRARRAGAATVLGSATPSVESAYNAEIGKFVLLRLDERVNDAPLPRVEVVDMAAAAKAGRVTHHFSRPLLSAMSDALADGHQVLILLNRRGFHSFFFCHACKTAVSCPHCDAALTHHRRMNALACHLCGHRREAISVCPTCEGETIQVGLGTERLEDTLGQLFPNRKLIRLDQDTTGGRHDFESKWKSMETGDIDIILGTQMIAKGLHLERVAVVGVALADITLHQPDFRAAERTFSLLTQVAGRAGRGKIAGRVFIQTYCPGHYATRHASEHDFDAFYRDELARRRASGFPPFSRLVAATLSGPDLDTLQAHADELGSELQMARRALGPDRLKAFGPLPPSVAKVKDQHRLRFLLSGPSSATLRDVMRRAIDAVDRRAAPVWRRHKLVIDVDPMDCG
jgi:primosomal protein N' (replication factor Y)